MLERLHDGRIAALAVGSAPVPVVPAGITIEANAYAHTEFVE